MKNKILATHSILGDITFNDVLNDLEIMLKDNEFFEEIVYQLLRQDNIPEEDLASLFDFSVTSRLKWIIDVLKDIL